MNSTFAKSTASTRSQIQANGNQLVVVVIKAQDLPNRKKLDKQSPYVVGRIQDQIQRTRVVPRGGQTPHFDQELWYSLDNVEGTTLNLTIYHQQKKDSELVCQADIDFMTALRRSTEEGYDAWFPLMYKNKPAGRIYLEMTYYPSVDSVPIAVENVSRNGKHVQMFTRSVNSNHRSNMDSSFRASQASRNLKSSLMSSYNSEMPGLPDLSAIEDEEADRNVKEHGKPLDKLRQSIASRLTDSDDERTGEEDSTAGAGAGAAKGGWFSKFIDLPISSFFAKENVPGASGSGATGKKGLAKPAYKRQQQENAHDNTLEKSNFQRQISSPQLVKDIPQRLFVDSSDEEEEEEEEEDDDDDDNDYDEAGFDTRIMSKGIENAWDLPSKKKEEDAENFEVGQAVEFRSSVRSHVTPQPSPTHRRRSPQFFASDDESEPEGADVIDVEKRISSMRLSFNNKPLPRPSDKKRGQDAPPPPRHLVSTNYGHRNNSGLRKHSHTRNQGRSHSRSSSRILQESNTPPRKVSETSLHMKDRKPSSETLTYSQIRRMKLMGIK